MSETNYSSSYKRTSFYKQIEKKSLTPLWEVMQDLVLPKPSSPCIPKIWKYDDIRKDILEAGDIISTEEAERRVLILENPGLPGTSRITRSLYAGMQLILPGETARNHRHTQTALRFVLEGSSAYTTVDGEKTTMKRGDLVITPSWGWHEHGNDGDHPTIWLDGLDIPLVQFLDASFAEPYEDNTNHPLPKPEGDSIARYGSGLGPIDNPSDTLTSPIFNYSYSETRDALEKMKRNDKWDACHGLKMKYANPLTGDYAMPTIAAFIQLLPSGFMGQKYRSTDSTVFVCVEGEGKTIVNDLEINWTKNDTFVIPSWVQHSHNSYNSDAVIFSFSDRGIQQKCGLWRENRYGN